VLCHWTHGAAWANHGDDISKQYSGDGGAQRGLCEVRQEEVKPGRVNQGGLLRCLKAGKGWCTEQWQAGACESLASFT